jgi:hypothetical protein
MSKYILNGLKGMEKTCIKMQALIKRVKVDKVYLLTLDGDEKKLIRANGFELVDREDGDESDEWFDVALMYTLLAIKDEDSAGMDCEYTHFEYIKELKLVKVEDLPLYVSWGYKSEDFSDLLKGA